MLISICGLWKHEAKILLLHLMLNGLYNEIGDIDSNGTLDILDCLLLVNIILER